MTIEEAKAILEQGQTLELDIDQTPSLSTHHHAFVNDQGEYTCTIYYGEKLQMHTPCALSRDWEYFLSRLPATMRESTSWVVM